MPSDSQKYDYLIIPRMRVSHANALAVYWLVSPVVMMPARQMMHALSRRLDLVEFEAGVSVIHHDYHLEGDYINGRNLPYQHTAAYGISPQDYISGKPVTLPSQPIIKQSLIVTLVLRYKQGAPIDMDEVNAFLSHGQLAGGVITDYFPIEFCSKMSEVRRLVKTGFLQFARHDKLYGPDADGLDTLISTLGTPPARNDNDEPDSWVMPALMGYQAISEIKPRIGSRDGYDSAYVEPLVGFIQMKSINHHPKGEPIPFWDYATTESLFCISQQ